MPAGSIRMYLSQGNLNKFMYFRFEKNKCFRMNTLFSRIRSFQKLSLSVILIFLISALQAQEKFVSRNIDTSKTITQKKSVAAIETIDAPVSQQYPITISKKAGEVQVVHDENYFLNEIKRIQSHISAIDHKVSVVSNDPVEKERAEKDAWFDQMARIRLALVDEQRNLEKELESLKK